MQMVSTAQIIGQSAVPAEPVAQAASPEPAAIPVQTTEAGTNSRPAPDPTRYGDWEKNGRCIDF